MASIIGEAIVLCLPPSPSSGIPSAMEGSLGVKSLVTRRAPLLRADRSMSISRWLQSVGWMATVTSSEATTHPLSATRALRLKGCFSSLIRTDPTTARPVEYVHPPTEAGVTKPPTLDSGTPLDRKTGLRSSACSRRDGCRTQNF